MKALVLSGGVAAGISWMLGIVEGLARGEAIELQRRPESAEIVVPFAIHRRPALEAGIVQAADELAAVREFWA